MEKHIVQIFTPPTKRECQFCEEEEVATYQFKIVQGEHSTSFFLCDRHFAQLTENIVNGKY